MKPENSKLVLGDTVKLNAYKIIDEAIERAVLAGLRRSKKHTDNPSEDHVAQEVHRYVMNELCEILKFDEDV